MEKSNMIISVIIVICIAAGVTAYGLTNQDNAFFSELPGLDSSNSGDGKGNATNGSGVGTGSGSSGSSSSGSGSSAPQTQTSNSQPSPQQRTPKISLGEATSIAHSSAEGYDDIRIVHEGTYYVARVYDTDGALVNVLLINDETGLVSAG